MYVLRVYKYDSEATDYKGEELTKYVLQGEELTEDLTQEIDTAELTLQGIDQKESFAPQTKFILELANEVADGQYLPLARFDREVATDIVSKPILSDDNYYEHHISFVEPSVDLQKRIVDNISATYKLKDVNLNKATPYPTNDAVFNMQSGAFEPIYNFGFHQQAYSIFVGDDRYYVGKYFNLETQPQIANENGETFEKEYLQIRDDTIDRFPNNRAKFILPRLAIMFGKNGTKEFENIGYASYDYKIIKRALNYITSETILSGSIISNSRLGDSTLDLRSYMRYRYKNEWLIEDWGVSKEWGNNDLIMVFTNYYKKYTDITASDPIYETPLFDIENGYRYEIEISLHTFDTDLKEDIELAYERQRYCKYSGENLHNSLLVNKHWAFLIFSWTASKVAMTLMQTGGTMSYVLYENNNSTIVYQSAVPYSALALLQKAIINSGTFAKQDGIYAQDVNNMKLPIYIDDEWAKKLAATRVIENFYNQKNLWEIALEVGHYIHAIPEVVFGEDDRLKITFNELGKTDKNTNANSGTTSIFNSRNIEDYICATSSYIDNMVQLGGYIEEWVSPKTNADSLLISNDTACLKVAKPIIELLDITIKANTDVVSGATTIPSGATADMTPYVFEEYVYNTLSLDYTDNPNRGIAMYYKLGTSDIVGGNYRLPQANTNIYTDYAFKKIIYSAYFGYPVVDPDTNDERWQNIKVKDFSFLVRYRTKDSVRQDHTRPDLRKYLVNTKYDEVPQHCQFNNQTDVVIDSEKFGTNMYGKLIKTGNNKYTTTEWNEDWANVKHKGDLVEINGDLYYVGKVLHTIYSSHIESSITYSKDYNELSAVIGIPSEPRFAEISEQSIIRREKSINDYLLLTDNDQDIALYPTSGEITTYMQNLDIWKTLIDKSKNVEYPKYAITVFKGDKDANNYSQTTGEKDTYIETMLPVNTYSSGTTLTCEWDCVDNYSAGDQILPVTDTAKGIDNQYYETLNAVRYTDKFGRATLVDFYLITPLIDIDSERIKKLPECPIATMQNDGTDRPYLFDYDQVMQRYNVATPYSYNNRIFTESDKNASGIALLKDCREAMSFNYNLQLITNSDTFVISPFLFTPSNTTAKIVFLSEEVNKLADGYINQSAIINVALTDGTAKQYFDAQMSGSATFQYFQLNMNYLDYTKIDPRHFTGEDNFVKVKSIALIYDINGNETPGISGKQKFVIARNIPDNWTMQKALSSWLFGTPLKSFFKNK